MSVRRLAPKELQPANFTFTPESLAWAKEQIAKYPPGRQASAAISILWRGGAVAPGGGSGAASPPLPALRPAAPTAAIGNVTYDPSFSVSTLPRRHPPP